MLDFTSFLFLLISIVFFILKAMMTKRTDDDNDKKQQRKQLVVDSGLVFFLSMLFCLDTCFYLPPNPRLRYLQTSQIFEFKLMR